MATKNIWVSFELVHRKWSSRKWSLFLNDPHVLTFWSVLGAATVSSLLCPWWQGGGGRLCPFSFVSLPHAWTPFLHSLHMSFTIFKIQLTALKLVKRFLIKSPCHGIYWGYLDSTWLASHYVSSSMKVSDSAHESLRHRTKHSLSYCYRLITLHNYISGF